MKRERVDPGWTWTKKFNFWVGWKLNETVQLSGLVAFDSDGGVVGKDDERQDSKHAERQLKGRNPSNLNGCSWSNSFLLNREPPEDRQELKRTRAPPREESACCPLLTRSALRSIFFSNSAR